jgi:putative ABC transport system ATP-binding protein
MKIWLQQVFPTYLSKTQVEQSSLWKKDLEFRKGEKIHIIAPSGSGKTSLIHFLYGMRSDFEGRILYGEQSVASIDAESLANLRKKNISIVFQDLRLFPEHTVTENIEVKRALEPFHSESRTGEMLQRLGLDTKARSLCRQCSYGEQQRIAIIRSLQQPFDFLLLDEPFSHLDENNRKLAMALIEEEADQRGAGILFADLKEIDYFHFDRKIFL